MDNDISLEPEDHANMINENLKDFERFLLRHFEILEKHGIWLFVATVGCYSVNSSIVRWIAFAVTLAILTCIFHRERKLDADRAVADFLGKRYYAASENQRTEIAYQSKPHRFRN